MSIELILIFFVLVAGFYMSWNIGANDVSNAMGTSVGSKALNLRQAVIIAAILEFSGALFLGNNVSKTLQSGIVDIMHFAHDPTTLLIGMFSALLATSIWLQIASYFGWPVSTTHAIVGAIVGFGTIIGGLSAVHWMEIASIASSWVISPLCSGVLAFLAFNFVQRTILYSASPLKTAKKLLPWITFVVLFVFGMTIFSDGIRHIEFSVMVTFLIAITMALTGFIVAFVIVRYSSSHPSFSPSLSLVQLHKQISYHKTMKHLKRLQMSAPSEEKEVLQKVMLDLEEIAPKISPPERTTQDLKFSSVERLFSYLQVLSACFVALAHGANDVANAIGPVASVIDIIRHPHSFSTESPVPIWLLLIGGVGIVIGLATWGWRVIETIGRKITELTPTRGFCAEFAAATTILLASKLGMPISTTHCIVGSVLGVGMARGISALNLRMLREIVLSWVVTIPSSAVCSIILFYFIKALIGNFSILSCLPL